LAESGKPPSEVARELGIRGGALAQLEEERDILLIRRDGLLRGNFR
jgi:hypothetical protein